MNDTSTYRRRIHHNGNSRRRILPPIYGGSTPTILEEVHLVSPRREMRPRSGSDSSSSSPTSAMDVPQPFLLKSPGLRGKGGTSREVDPLLISLTCKAPSLLQPEHQHDEPKGSHEQRDMDRATTLREFRNNSRSFRKAHSVPVDCALTPPLTNCRPRRSIFDNFWHSDKSGCSQPPPPPPSAVDEEISSAANNSDVVLASWLPAVPSPLVRMHSHCGVYPLVTPKSILRKAKSLEGSSKCYTTEKTKSVEHPELTKTRRDELALFNLTHSTRRIPPRKSVAPPPHEEDYHYVRCVHFDPRVVVTELADAEPRVWYTNDELQNFQSETVLLARSSLQSHPQLIPKYSKPVRNSVTGTMRKRALFSLAIFLIDNPPDDENEEEAPVQRIRIVDPHPATLSLLRRSFAALFPEATIDCRCGDEDYRYNESNSNEPNCDIIVLDGAVLQKTTLSPKTTNALVIGLTTRNCPCNENSVDIVWDKPIPSINEELHQSLLQALADKRGKP